VIHFLRRRIALKLTLTLVGFVGVAVLAAGLYLNRALESFAIESLEARLAITARLLHDEARALLQRGAAPGELREFVLRSARPTDSRVTLIAADGRVVADSDVAPADLAGVENHALRPEVQAPLAGKPGRALRMSTTVHEPLFYVGAPVRDGHRVIGVLRLALPLSAVTSSYAALHRVMLLGGLVALAVAFGIGVFVSGRITRPVVEMQGIARRMSEGDFEARAPVRSIDEVGALGRALNVMAQRLHDKIQDLEDEHAKVAAILDGMVEGVVAVDGHDQILLMNERARAMFAVDQGRGLGKPLLEVIRNSDLHAVLRATRVGAAGAAAPHEFRVAALPVERVIRVSAVPLLLGAAEHGAVMVLHDVTVLRQLEQARTEFVANVSHELRTPLTAIQGYLETLLGGALDERENAEKFLEIVFRHTERLGRLLNDLTDLSNIELGKVALHLAPIALGPVVESVFAILKPRAAAGGVVLESAVPGGLPAVQADRDRLEQILINLVDNAVKYSRRGGRVTVGGAVIDSATVEIAVRDSGVGIPAADLPRITERFYRVDRARSRELGGTGLGLAIVKHLVLAHGGELRIESMWERGTVVRFTLKGAAGVPAGVTET
jgi:two-component system phosphate regulon sensor histidine kinase PhoR